MAYERKTWKAGRQDGVLWGVVHQDDSISVTPDLEYAQQLLKDYRARRILKLNIDENPVGETEVEVTSYLFSYNSPLGHSGAVSYNHRGTAEGDRKYMIAKGTSCSEIQEIKQKIKVQKKLNA